MTINGKVILVVNEVRIEEIRKEIGRVETAQDECRKYLKKLQEIETHSYEFLKCESGLVDEEFEICREDEYPRLRNLIEEKSQLLQQMSRECDDLLDGIADDQRNFDYQCSEKINELELEMRELQMEVV